MLQIKKLLALREKVGFSRPEHQTLFQQFYANSVNHRFKMEGMFAVHTDPL
jgi:hypothetical protein